MFSFLTQLRDQVFTRRDSCPEESCQTTTYTVPEKLDEEDDGYLLVGDTRAGQNKVSRLPHVCGWMDVCVFNIDFIGEQRCCPVWQSAIHS